MPRQIAEVKIPSGHDLDLPALLDDWMDALEARNLSPDTRKTYRDGVRAFLAWCEREGRPAVLDPAAVSAFATWILGHRKPATARSRQVAVRRFSKWLARKEIIPADLLAGMEQVEIGQNALRPLSDEQLAALLRACAGKTFADKRDNALLRLMAELGLRASEAASLTVSGLDPRARTVAVWGKGGKGRLVRYGAVTAEAVNDYLRLRRSHRLAGGDALWLGRGGRRLGYYGVYGVVQRRMTAAGIPVGPQGFSPHSLRRTMATRWREREGSPDGLMAIGGWTRLESIAPYTRAASARLAAEEADRLRLGEI